MSAERFRVEFKTRIQTDDMARQSARHRAGERVFFAQSPGVIEREMLGNFGARLVPVVNGGAHDGRNYAAPFPCRLQITSSQFEMFHRQIEAAR